jgi:uncharacterized protein (DUF2249 family)
MFEQLNRVAEGIRVVVIDGHACTTLIDRASHLLVRAWNYEYLLSAEHVLKCPIKLPRYSTH